MPDPVTGEGFDAPSPEVAYMGAPDLIHETAELTALSERLRAETANAVAEGTYEFDEHQERLILLRRAALSDRLSLAYPDVEEFVTDAAKLAHELARFDRDHGTHQGPIGPGAIEWDPSHRPYIRQEYDHWGW
ncbi:MULTISPECIES: hypothetical protein [unclassified Streptomyces]|uniref:hypothetical protein n=1 Tax=unclassified Streptomyces TaxID=2593676 RepID=UPI00380EA768